MMDGVSLWPAALLGAVVVAVLAAWLIMRQRRADVQDRLVARASGNKASSARPGRPASYDELDTVLDWEPASTRLLTHLEREAYQVLRKALPNQVILAQVPIARFLKVPTRNSYAEWLRRVGYLCVDLVVCDASSQVLAVVEVRSAKQPDSEGQHRRQQRAEKVLRAAHVLVHVWHEGALPDAASVREAILGPDADSSEAQTVDIAFDSSISPGVLKNVADPDGLDFNLDDLGAGLAVKVGIGMPEHRDPPPSTWFDDLEPTMPAPLDEVPPSQRPR